MTNGDRLIRTATAAVVTAVAAVVSYSRAYDLGRTHGQSGAAARLLPLLVYGLLLAASLVLLHEARNRRAAPWLARLMLWLGIAATLGANVAYGVPYGPLGALVSAWPAVSFVGAVELLMMLVRTSARRIVEKTSDESQSTTDTILAPVPTDAESAALIALRATLAAGNPLSPNQLMERFGLTRAAASKVRQRVNAESNGQQAEENCA